MVGEERCLFWALKKGLCNFEVNVQSSFDTVGEFSLKSLCICNELAKSFCPLRGVIWWFFPFLSLCDPYLPNELSSHSCILDIVFLTNLANSRKFYMFFFRTFSCVLENSVHSSSA